MRVFHSPEPFLSTSPNAARARVNGPSLSVSPIQKTDPLFTGALRLSGSPMLGAFCATLCVLRLSER